MNAKDIWTRAERLPPEKRAEFIARYWRLAGPERTEEALGKVLDELEGEGKPGA